MHDRWFRESLNNAAIRLTNCDRHSQIMNTGSDRPGGPRHARTDRGTLDGLKETENFNLYANRSVRRAVLVRGKCDAAAPRARQTS